MRRYRIQWKTLKMQKNRKIFQTNSHKSYEILQRIFIRHHMTSLEYYQCNTKRKVGKSKLQVPDTGTRVLSNTRPFLRSSIVSFWITPACSKEPKYHIFRQYWYTKNVPVFTNTGTFQYLGPEVYFFSKKLRFIEIGARKLHLSVMILGLKNKFFENKSIRFHYSFEYFNDYLPFKCLMVV